MVIEYLSTSTTDAEDAEWVVRLSYVRKQPRRFRFRIMTSREDQGGAQLSRRGVPSARTGHWGGAIVSSVDGDSISPALIFGHRSANDPC